MIYRNDHYGPIDRFCAKHPRFGIPNLMKIIVIAQIVVFALNLVGDLIMKTGIGSGVFSYYLWFIPAEILRGQVWRLVSWLIVPNDSNIFYLLLGCYFYYWIGSVLEREWGTARFSLFYLSGVVLSVVLGMVLGMVQLGGAAPLDLAYYLNLSIFLVMATTFGETRILLFFVIPIKMKWMALIDVVLVAINMIEYFSVGVWSLALVPLASFVNYFIFTWPFWAVKLGIVRRKADPSVINFKRARKAAQKKQESASYLHKCAVCGLTDQDDPNMEFRYCSRCDGYHCYCANHISNHIHIRED